MKKYIRTLFILMLVFALAACSGGNDSSENTGTEEGTSSVENSSEDTSSGKEEGEMTDGNGSVFTYAIIGDTGNTLNPITADDRYGLMTTHLVYAPAYFINPDGSVDYILAEEMESSEDGLTYTMKLKEDLKWSDGEPLTADDIVYSYETINNTTQNLYVAGEPIAVEKIDDLTVKFTLPSVSAGAFEALSAEVSIVPKHIFEARNSFDLNMLEDEVIGAGPYVLEEYKTGQYLKFKANPNYAKGEPQIDTIIFQIFEQADTATLAMQNGDINAIIALPDDVPKFEGNESFEIHNYTEGRVAYLGLNPKSEKMQDKNFREGVLHALNRDEIMMAAYSDPQYYELGYSFLPYTNEYYSDDVEKWDQDVELAKEKVSGGATQLTIAYSSEDTAQEREALTIQSQLSQVGIQVDLLGLNGPAYIQAIQSADNTDYDMYLGGYVMATDPDSYSALFHSNKDNIVRYDNSEVDKLFDEGNGTNDKAEREEIYLKLQQEIANEAIFYPLGSNMRTLITTSNVGNIEGAKLVPIYTFGDYGQLTME